MNTEQLRGELIKLVLNATDAQLQVYAINIGLTQVPDTGNDAWRYEGGFPKVKNFSGCNVMAAEPINPKWKPGIAAYIFGTQPGTFVRDPSNGMMANPPQPLRSAAGYPLVYALGAGGVVIGAPQVVYADATFKTDAELERYAAAP
jgi:hypothetical protein